MQGNWVARRRSFLEFFGDLMFSKTSRFLATVRHLRPVQVYGRLWFRLNRQRPDMSPAPDLGVANGTWQPPAPRTASLIGEGKFWFLGERGSLAEHGWDDPSKPKLWRYNQHYFDDLNAQASAERTHWHQALIADWVVHNPPGQGTGWEPYPTSLRIVNWVKWALAGNSLSEGALGSLAVQTRWLTGRLEWHLLGNHLFANAKALVYAGLFFDGPEAKGWLRQGLRILAREFPEQVLPDGGQFERSPMYHALALEDVLDLVNVTRFYKSTFDPQGGEQRALWEGIVPPMQHWLSAMSHPDGEISFFNDAAFGIAPAPAELAAYAGRLGFEPLAELERITWLNSSGYARLESAPAVLICDMAPIGPDYLPGHAHADTLSFEFSLFGQRVIVNSGTSQYGLGAERLRQRGTRAHSTVTVAGKNSSDVWSGFRVGSRARPLGASVTSAEGCLMAECGHDGYRALSGNPRHMRKWILTKDTLTVCDAVSPDQHVSEARFYLHPGVRLELSRKAFGVLALPCGAEVCVECEGGTARLEQGTWHPEFGLAVENTCLVIPLRNGRARLQLRWAEMLQH